MMTDQITVAMDTGLERFSLRAGSLVLGVHAMSAERENWGVTETRQFLRSALDHDRGRYYYCYYYHYLYITEISINSDQIKYFTHQLNCK